MNPLASRKQLLLAESDLNRAELAGDLAALAADARALTDRAKSYGSLASSAAVLLAGLAAFRRGTPAAAVQKPTLMGSVFKYAGLVSTFWLAWRSPGSRRSSPIPQRPAPTDNGR